MADLNGHKTKIQCLLLAAMALMCLFVYLSIDSFGEGGRALALRFGSKFGYTQKDSETLELVKVLREATNADKTVIVTTINEAWAAPGAIFDLFLESFRIGEETKQLLNHLVVVALDSKAFTRCKSVHKHCYLLPTKDIDFSAEKRYMSHDYLEMMWRRLELLRTILQLGYSFIFTDSDIMWFRNPFSYISNSVELAVASDAFYGSLDKRNRANCGFLYARSCDTMTDFYDYWLMSKSLYPGRNEQHVFDIILRGKYASRMHLRMSFLDTAYFGGFCHPNKDFNKVRTMHANCCIGEERKIHDLRVLLEDWRNYTARPEEERKAGGFSWRVPDKCRV